MIVLDQNKIDKLSNKELIQLERICCEENPFYLIEKGLLKIKTKDGRLLPLILNKPQQELFNIIKERREQKKPIRIWILKARQIGFSTLVEAIIYCLTSQQKNRNSLIMASEKEKSSNLFDMSKLYQEELGKDYAHLICTLRKSNEKKLEFEGQHSMINIATAENPDAARAFTYQYVHLSEVAYFNKYDAIMTALGESVPKEKDIWDTMIIGETTANGMNHFYDEWMRAIEGKTDWIPFFAAWWEHEPYRLSLQDGKLYPIDGIVFDAEDTMKSFLDEEAKMVAEYGLDQEQLNWRREKIVNDKKGDITAFRQENPSNWQEAFTMSGALYFDRKGLDRQMSVKPIMTGEIFEENMKFIFRELPYGRIKIYRKPVAYEQYLVALDASEGIDRDNAAGVVLNKRLNRVEAIVNGQYAPEELAHLGIMLAQYFNKATVVPENKGYGHTVCQLVFQNYGNVYRRTINTGGTLKRKEELGYNTNSVTRPQYLAQMNEEIRVGSTQLVSAELIHECHNFVIKRDKDGNVKKVEAQAGQQDGLVICRAIAGIVRMEQPFIAKTSATHFRQSYAVRQAKAKQYVEY